MNKLILENTLKDLDMAKTKLIKRILYDFLRYIKFLEEYKVWYDDLDGAKAQSLKKHFMFKEAGNKIYCIYNDIGIKMIIVDVLLSLPFEMKITRKKFRKYKNKYGYLCNQEDKVIHKIWKMDVQPIIDNIFYKDLSNLIMEYL